MCTLFVFQRKHRQASAPLQLCSPASVRSSALRGVQPSSRTVVHEQAAAGPLRSVLVHHAHGLRTQNDILFF